MGYAQLSDRRPGCCMAVTRALVLVALALPAAAQFEEGEKQDQGVAKPPPKEVERPVTPPRSYTPSRTLNAVEFGKGELTIAFGAGDETHETIGASPPLDGEVDSTYFRLGLAAADGGVLRFGLEWMASDDDLFPTFAGEESSEMIDVEFLGGGEVRGRRARLQIMGGLTIHQLSLDFDPQTVDWLGVGFRLAVAPEIALVASDDGESFLSAFGMLSGSFSVYDIDASTQSETFTSTGTQFGVDVGLRVQAERFVASLSYVLRSMSVDDSDPAGGVFVREIDHEFSGIVASVGVRF